MVILASGNEARTVAIAGVDKMRSPMRSVRESRIFKGTFELFEVGFVCETAGGSQLGVGERAVDVQVAQSPLQAARGMQAAGNCVEAALQRIESGRKIRAPMRVKFRQLHGRARL